MPIYTHLFNIYYIRVGIGKKRTIKQSRRQKNDERITLKEENTRISKKNEEIIVFDLKKKKKRTKAIKKRTKKSGKNDIKEREK